MGLTRKSTFGFPNPSIPGSVHTTRLVPLTQGVRLDQPWPLLPPGSAQSMTNFLPLDGALVPRSRLSSLNTLRTIGGTPAIVGIAELPKTSAAAPEVWISGASFHARLNSNGSISLASFTSAFGLGVAGIPEASYWEYAPVYLAAISNNGLVAAAAGPSGNTLQVLYSVSGVYRYSYLTSAPKADHVTTFDNYVIAFNIGEGGTNNKFDTRVQWSVRGNPSNWTSEGSGFEDLLQMKGFGTAIRVMPDGRFVLFSNEQIWYGVGATYPAQFQFNVLDPSVGCHAGRTIQDTDEGLLFLGSDNALRLLPRGGGASRVVVPSIQPVLRRRHNDISQVLNSWAVYDPLTKLYHLFLNGSGGPNFVVNTHTGEWGFSEYPGHFVNAGAAIGLRSNFGRNEGLFLTNSTGTVFSTNSLLATDSGSAVTMTWHSTPLGSDLAGNHKQVTKVCLDYRSTSTGTLTQKISQDGGNTYQSVGETVVLNRAPVSGRAEKDVFIGGAFPAIELTSTSTGFELHRLDVSMNIAGRK
jgi:hypothetical protein